MSTKNDEILEKIVDEWARVEDNKHRIEGKAGFTVVNVKYIENLRHAFSHFMAGLKLQKQDVSDDEIGDQYKSALNHLKNLDVNGHEYLAGMLLKRLRNRIEYSGYFINADKSKNFFEEASNKFEMGRSSRTESKDQAMVCFESCIDLCQKGLREVVPPTKAEKTRIGLTAISVVLALAAFIRSFFF